MNEKQIEAIKKLNGRVRIIAGAGSGKTTVLTYRYMELLNNNVNPDNILCVTFTNKAAKEMKDRICPKIFYTGKLHIQTFHSFCLEVLRRDIHILNYPNNFAILDAEDQNSILKDIYKEADIDYDLLSYGAAKSYIQNRKIKTEDNFLDIISNNNTLKDTYEECKNQYKEKRDKDTLVDTVYYGYLYYEKKNISLDFTDLIVLAVFLLKTQKDVLSFWQNKFEYIMVDEFQDVSLRQNELVELLSAKHGNLFVVGDPDQTIYSWRGADPAILVDFDKKGKTETILLDENYRSTPEILDVANKIISKNTLRVKKDLFTHNPSGCKVEFYHAENSKKEGLYIANTIKTLLKKYKPKDIVILYRMHYLSRSIEEQLIKNNIPYTIFSGVNFYERKEIKDILAYLKLLINPQDDISLKRIINVPSRKIGLKKIQQMEEYAKSINGSLWEVCNSFYLNSSIKQLSSLINCINYLSSKVKSLTLTELLDEVLDKTGYYKLLKESIEEERLENIEELKESIKDYNNKTLEEYLQEISLLTNTDKKSRDAVSMMTIHSSKGLEFPIVFVIGLTEGVFPNYKAYSLEEKEEERRLAYVAYTRAKEKLILTDCGGNNFNGSDKETSRFVTEIEPNIITNIPKETIFKAKKFSSYNGKCKGQYFKNGHYYDWDDDTYLQGSVDFEDIVPECELY